MEHNCLLIADNFKISLTLGEIFIDIVLRKNIGSKGWSFQMRTSPETGCIGVWCKQTILVRVGGDGEGRVEVTELLGDSPPLSIV